MSTPDPTTPPADAATMAVEETKPHTEPTNKPKTLPPYAVMLHNDELNTMEFVIEVLQKVFGYSAQKAVVLMFRAHETGKALVFSGHKELAEVKADQIRSCGADPIARERGASPLNVTVEPMPA